VELGKVIKLAPSRKQQETRDKQQAAWDKPLTTDFQKDRRQIPETRSEIQETSHGQRGLVLGFRHKVLRS
jgi:hypothetical protein